MDARRSVPLEETSAEAVGSLGADEMLERMRGTVTPYQVRASFFDRDYKFNISPMAIAASKLDLRSLLNSSLNSTRTLYTNSRFENLLNEILLNIVRFVDLASLVKFAACNSGVRGLVTSIPYVRTVKSHPATSLALSRMLRAGTAKYFNLQRFIDTITTSTCMVCKDHTSFASWMCLFLCHRVCVKCLAIDQQTIRTPKSMAVNCLSLSVDDVATGSGTASAALQPTFVQSESLRQNGLESSKIIRRDNKIDLISLRVALTLSIDKHAAVGGPSHVKLLIEHSLQEHHPRKLMLRVSGLS